MQVFRTFGHNDGYGTTMPVKTPIQPRVGQFSEDALRRYDYVMDALAKVIPGTATSGPTYHPPSGFRGLTSCLTLKSCSQSRNWLVCCAAMSRILSHS